MEKVEIFERTRRIFGRYFVLVLILGGCTSHPCREPRAPELDRTKTPPAVPGATLNTEGTKAAQGAAPVKDSKAATDAEFVRVYKPDGSRQCEKKPGILLDTMERELAGIVVQGRDKRKDGLMHIQVCGSPSGMINVFEIKANFLKQAEQRGFKRLED